MSEKTIDTSVPAKDRMKKRVVLNVSMGNLKPYWKNVKTGSNFEEVKLSIERFGNKGYIDVDENMVIIAGHSRFKALKSLNAETTDINIISWLSDREVAELRIVDNEVASMNVTDYDLLKVEVRELGVDFLQNFFAIDLTDFIKFDDMKMDNIEIKDISTAQEKIRDKFNGVEQTHHTSVVCPHCLNEFELDNTIKHK